MWMAHFHGRLFTDRKIITGYTFVLTHTPMLKGYSQLVRNVTHYTISPRVHTTSQQLCFSVLVLVTTLCLLCSRLRGIWYHHHCLGVLTSPVFYHRITIPHIDTLCIMHVEINVLLCRQVIFTDNKRGVLMWFGTQRPYVRLPPGTAVIRAIFLARL